MSLQHHLNGLHISLRNEAFLPNFTPPGIYTGELVGIEYLRSQSDVLANTDLEKEIDEVFEDYQSEEDAVDEPLIIQDLTLALPEESSESDSGTEVNTAHCNAANKRKLNRMTTVQQWIQRGSRIGIRSTGLQKPFSTCVRTSQTRRSKASNVCMLTLMSTIAKP